MLEVSMRLGMPQVTTQDGYFLTFQRIRNTTVPRNLPGRTIPVLLDHALMLGADLWFGLVNVHDRTLDKRFPVLLANRGHDVFVMSHRCTEWSQPHVRYNTRDWVSPLIRPHPIDCSQVFSCATPIPTR